MIVGLNRTQDASICVLSGDQPVCLQKERITRQKHDWGKRGDLNLYRQRLVELTAPVELVVECYSSDREAGARSEYHREIVETFGACEIIEISHHLAHAYSAFFPSGFTEAAVMVIDFQGSRVADCAYHWPGRADSPPEALEVASFYTCRGLDLTCVGKQLWDGDRKRPRGLGSFYQFMTQCIFPGEGQEGKVMGLAPFGDPRALGLPALRFADGEVIVPEAWTALFADSERFRYREGDDERFALAANLAAAGQRVFEEALLETASWLEKRTGTSSLCFAGGTALNCVANGRILREGRFARVFVPPSPHDGGTALGCALYGAVARRRTRPPFVWSHDFLGPLHTVSSVESLGLGAEFIVERPSDFATAIAEAIADDKAVALFNGRSESGPRALGHRSILADPRSDNVRRWLNARVKGREAFRPLAPLVLEEHASRYFDVDCPLPFMQFAATVREAQRASVPAATHVDGTARIQTVAEQNDPLLHGILRSFQKLTGLPILLNTSLNGPGQPLVETVAEAVDLFRSTPLHVLAVAPFLVTKRERGESPCGYAGT